MHDLLLRMAKKYIWWKAPVDESLSQERIVAQVMNIGDFYDVRSLWNAVGSKPFCQAIERAEAGWFNKRSWAYWHYRCGLRSFDEPLPPLPKRNIK
jgi:hypothetical protein